MKLTPEILLSAYQNGYFPMGNARKSSEVLWYSPDPRAVIPLDAFHIPASLAKFMRKSDYEVRLNTRFEAVIRACADKKTKERQETWINDEIIRHYCELARTGYAMSVETWQDNVLIGGLYGVKIGRAFFGESMYSDKPNASKFALVHLVQWLRQEHYILLDTQYVNEHLLQFGVVEIPKSVYLEQLKVAIT